MNNGVKTFTITSQPFYDQYNECYKNILMVNLEPQGPIRKFVRRITLKPKMFISNFNKRLIKSYDNIWLYTRKFDSQ